MCGSVATYYTTPHHGIFAKVYTSPEKFDLGHCLFKVTAGHCTISSCATLQTVRSCNSGLQLAQELKLKYAC